MVRDRCATWSLYQAGLIKHLRIRGILNLCDHFGSNIGYQTMIEDLRFLEITTPRNDGNKK